MGRQSESCFLIAIALIVSTIGFSYAQQDDAREQTPSGKNRFTQNFLAQHEIGHRFRIDATELPPPKTSAIVTNRALTLRDLNRSATNIPSKCRIASIVLNDAIFCPM